MSFLKPYFESVNQLRKSKPSLELSDPLLDTAAGIALELASSVCQQCCSPGRAHTLAVIISHCTCAEMLDIFKKSEQEGFYLR